MDYQNAQIAYKAISRKQSSKGVGITSPLTGYIKNILVKDGEYVTAGQTTATVSQNKRLVLRADVSEKHYTALQFKVPILKLLTTIRYMPCQNFPGNCCQQENQQKPILFSFRLLSNSIIRETLSPVLLSKFICFLLH